ncbi:phosphoenolpyruvate--protein phosphotransferase [Abyssicoccus albus]|uniref:phosphoenolpyruvate--protein phosphotransferase n=1 Tax=Abyssicoccus albus TaxID=1817405 RepID=UPI00097E1CC2|nr:phosphoenolpyruvate--protein phosphotransferase [Abyssicoccus albus]AQL55930.1 phosphoenolpyruvate--protein phosphotransferase [Abyssicoccus albus]
MSKIIQGIQASDGISIAPCYLFVEPNLNIDKKTIDNPQQEITRFDNAMHESKVQLTKIRNTAEEALGAEHAAIFDAHLLVLDDPELINPIKEAIEQKSVNAESALEDKANEFIQIFESMDNEYMKERAADIRDVSKRIKANLLGVELPSPATIDHEVIVVAHDLTPSDTAQLNKQFVKGFVTNIGGRTSHSAIMARSLEIPAVVGTKSIIDEVNNGDILIIDGEAGVVIVDPTEEEISEYTERARQVEQDKEELKQFVEEKTETKDGHHVELAANIGTPKDVDSVIENGGEGVGLFRTEFLYMGRDNMPTEDEQFESYKTVLEAMDGKPVVVRTLDIGGDKELSYLDMPEELNPFLGYRAIRLCLDREDIFRPQLRALLRASTYGTLKIMFPMVATIDEFRQAKSILLDEKEKLKSEGHDVSDDIEVGIMVEIPATAMIAKQFAKEVDFFSIGTNDLIQYTFAADRMSEHVSYLYQPFNPSLLHLIKNVIDASHEADIWTGMCGEMAGDSRAIPLLLGLGLDEFSMSATSILKARRQMKSLTTDEMKKLSDEALQCSTSEEVLDLVNAYVK